MSEPQTIRVIAVIVGEKTVTFFKEDGVPVNFPQGDSRVPKLVETYFSEKNKGAEVVELMININEKRQEVVQNLTKRSLTTRLFVAAKKALYAFTGRDAEGVAHYRTSPEDEAAIRASIRERVAALTSRPDPTQQDEIPLRLVTGDTILGDEETIVAITGEGMVDGVENIHALVGDSEVGTNAERLIERLAAISSERRHTAQELLDFIAKLHLPPLPDGSFIGYKRLKKTKHEGVYADPHTGRVFQRVGDTVEVPENMVDPDRRSECSRGLHVGSQQYMGGFAAGSSSVTAIVLVEPEDVIAVPYRDRTKLRTCKYRILGLLDDQSQNSINVARTLPAGTTTAAMITAILGGNTPPEILGRVHIAGESGTKLTYTINGISYPPETTFADALKISGRNLQDVSAETTETVYEEVKTVDVETQAEAVKVNKKTTITVTTKDKVSPVSLGQGRNARAQALWAAANNGDLSKSERQQAAQDLLALKKKSKVSWATLGLEDWVKGTLDSLIAADKKVEPAPAPVKAASKPVAQKPSAKERRAKQKELTSVERKAIAMQKEGKYSVSEIARKLNMSRTSLRRLLAKHT